MNEFMAAGGRVNRLVNKPLKDPGDLTSQEIRDVLAGNGFSKFRCT